MKISLLNSNWVSIHKNEDGELLLNFNDGNGNLIEVGFEKGWLNKRWFKDMIKQLNDIEKEDDKQ